MASRWGNSGKSVRLIFLGSKITEDSDCSHEIKRRLLLGGNAMTNLDSVLKSRDITLLTKAHIITRWQNRRMYAHLLMWELQNYNLLLKSSIGECWIPPKKDTPHPRAKEKPQQDGRRGKMSFRIKRHTLQRSLEGSNKTLCARGDPTETEPDLPLNVWVSPVEVRVSSGLLQGQGLWVQQTWVWHKCSWRRSPLTPQ